MYYILCIMFRMYICFAHEKAINDLGIGVYKQMTSGMMLEEFNCIEKGSCHFFAFCFIHGVNYKRSNSNAQCSINTF